MCESIAQLPCMLYWAVTDAQLSFGDVKVVHSVGQIPLLWLHEDKLCSGSSTFKLHQLILTWRSARDDLFQV